MGTSNPKQEPLKNKEEIKNDNLMERTILKKDEGIEDKRIDNLIDKIEQIKIEDIDIQKEQKTEGKIETIDKKENIKKENETIETIEIKEIKEIKEPDTETQSIKKKEVTPPKPIPIIKREEPKITPFSTLESTRYIIKYYDDFIDILNCFLVKKAFVKLARSFNENYLVEFNAKKFPENLKQNQEFLKSFKFSSIIIACFIFLTKDSAMYKNTSKKIKDSFEQFIFASLDNIDKQNIFSLKIISFIQKYKKIKRSMSNCVSGIVKDLFKKRISYKNILSALEQILNNINNESTQNVVIKVNDCILFCYNNSTVLNNISNSEINNNIKDKKENPKENTKEPKSKRDIRNKGNNTKENKNKTATNVKNVKTNNKNNNNTNSNNKDNIENNENKENNDKNVDNDVGNGTAPVNPPFITKEMDKKFCLVLDIDETLSHTVKLPFGNYFLLRPGVIDFLKDLSNYYEIIIFTAALKHYADYILNKIDRNSEYINYRLYRCHCVYEDGKSVKKLCNIGRDMNKIVFVDDLKRNAKYNPRNLSLVGKWIDNVYDDEMYKLKNKLEIIATCGKYDDDVTQGLIDEKY